MVHVLLASMMLLSHLALEGPARQNQATPPAVQKRPLDPAVKRDGWWIRVNRQAKADTITWRFTESTEGKDASITWHRANDPDTFDLPEAVRLKERLGFEVLTEPTNAPGSFCLFYASRGVQLVELSSSASSTSRRVDSKQRDKNCTP